LAIDINELQNAQNIEDSRSIIIIATKDGPEIKPYSKKVAISPYSQSLIIRIGRELTFDKAGISPIIILRVIPKPANPEQGTWNKNTTALIRVTKPKKVIQEGEQTFGVNQGQNIKRSAVVSRKAKVPVKVLSAFGQQAQNQYALEFVWKIGKNINRPLAKVSKSKTGSLLESGLPTLSHGGC
jgi:hypothetical protein